ncbi:MAG TPA: metal ABC transporter permease [Chloroflexota bacterium]|jgi:manganese/iron transport system permease protein/iron/zinc/copper transport system permease protein
MALLEPFHYEFFTRGMLAATLAGALCGLVGVYVVLRHMSYIGHGLSHAIFGGAVLGYVLQLNFYLAAGTWGFLAALAINETARRRRIGADAAIGIVTTASFALGVAIISRARQFTKNFEAALFGNVLGVSNDDVLAIAAAVVVCALVLFFAYKQLLFTTFDPEVARVYGVPTAWMDTLLALVLATTIVVSMQVLGVTLIAAALIIPAVVARQLTDSFGRMTVLSTAIGATCGALGLYLSYYLDAASGATVVLVASGLFLLSWLYADLRGRSRGPAWRPTLKNANVRVLE